MARIDHHLVDDADILAAARWRLSAWSGEEIEHACCEVGALLAHGMMPDSRDPRVVAILGRLARPGDRRGAWSALCALVVLCADARGLERLFLLAGFEVLGAWRNARAKADGKESPLTCLMREYQRNQPQATAGEHFDLLAGLAGMDPLIVDYNADADAITYDWAGRLKDVTRASFARQFRRVAEEKRTQGDVSVSSSRLFPSQHTRA